MSDAEIVKRLERLERDNRRLKRGAFVLLALLVALTAIYATRPVPDVIRAQKFEVVDSAGKERISLGVQNDGAAIVSILDSKGVMQAAMLWSSVLGPEIDLGFHKATPAMARLKGFPHGALSADITVGDSPLAGPAVMLTRGGSLGPSVNLGVTPSGQPNVVLDDSKGIERAGISLFPGGSPLLEFVNEGGRATVRLMAAENSSSLEFIGSQNRKMGKFSVGVDRMQLSTWGLDFDDKDGTSAISLGGVNPGVADTTERALSFSDAKGSTRASIYVSPTGAPNLELDDSQGYGLNLGVTGTVTPLSGQTQQTSAASIVMYGNDKEHRVIWRAP